MYAQIDQFAIDKATNALVEEGIAPLYIREYYRTLGKKVWKGEKNMTTGPVPEPTTWSTAWREVEVKADRLWQPPEGSIASSRRSTRARPTSTSSVPAALM